MNLRRWIMAMAAATLLFTGMAGPINPTVSTARAATTLDVCGNVAVYVAPTVALAGILTIGPVAAAIAAGTTVPSAVAVDADICLRLTIDSGSITNIVYLRADATSSVRICGTITAFAAATSTATGSLTIAGRVFKIAVGESLPASVRVGANLCLDLDLNALGHIRDGSVTANATATVKICGTVTAHASASLTSTGSLKIAGRTFVLALGSSLPASVRVGADLCLTLELNGFGQVQDGSATADVSATLRICGAVTAYTAASLTSYGSLTVAGRTFVLALGSDLPTSVRVGANLCLTLEINAFGQVKDGTAVANVSTSVQVCGTVTAFAAATLTQTGSLTIDGRSFVIGLGADLPASVRAGADLCLTLRLNVFGQVKDGSAVAFVTSTLDVCGQVTAVAAAGSTINGSLTIAGVSRTVAAGTSLSAQVQVGAYLKLRLTLDVFGRIDDDIVLAAGASLAAACGTADPAPSASPDPSASPSPSSSPSSSPGPSTSPAPSTGPTPDPSGGVLPTDDPGGSPVPGASNDPSAGPGGSSAPDPSATPSGGTGSNSGDPTCVAGDVSSGSGNGDAALAGGPLPDTASLARTGALVMVASVPLLVIGGVLLGAWLVMSRRRRDALVEVPLDADSQGRS